MTPLEDINRKILDYTVMLQERYPELYRDLEETPQFHSDLARCKVDFDFACTYLDSLKEILAHYLQSGKIRRAQGGK